MLTPKHRALFAAAYSSQLLTSPREEVDPETATPQPNGNTELAAKEQESGDRPSAA
jgi:hypothetical protein